MSSRNAWKDVTELALERLKYLLESGYETDVEFLVGNEATGTESIKAHKFVLGTMSSSVFDAQFSANVINGLASDEPIKVIDVEPSAFRAMLKFIYSNDLAGINKTNIAAVLATAKKYLLPAFAKKCVELAFELLNVENALGLLKVAEFHQEKVLAEHCWAFVDQSIENIVESDEFLMLTQNEIKEMFERDTLWGDELALFNALDRWAQKQCRDQNIENPSGEQKRAAMGAALKAIRFPLMSAEDFNNKIALTKILKWDELATILLHNSEATTSEAKACISMPFSDKFRESYSNPTNKWNAADCGHRLNISEEGLVVKHSGPADGRSTVRAILPIRKINQLDAKQSSIMYYFEGKYNTMRYFTNDFHIGFCDRQFLLGEKLIGQLNNSIGMLSKCGMYVDGSIRLFDNMSTFSYIIFLLFGVFKAGDVVGMGLAHCPENSSLKCFSTCNGILLGSIVLPSKFKSVELFPAASVDWLDSFEANFGQKEWLYNPYQFLKNLIY